MSTEITQCECPMAGFCKRHGIIKSSHLHKLCQNHNGYFQMWEECRGPNQNPNDCVKNATEPKTNFNPPTVISDQKEEKLPSTMQMAKNFVQSAANHVANGMKTVSEEKQKERLDICNDCEFLIKNSYRCGKCGCFLKTKTKWESSSCPIGKW